MGTQRRRRWALRFPPGLAVMLAWPTIEQLDNPRRRLDATVRFRPLHFRKWNYIPFFLGMEDSVSGLLQQFQVRLQEGDDLRGSMDEFIKREKALRTVPRGSGA